MRKLIIMSSFIVVFFITAITSYATEFFIKTSYEEFVRYHDFDNWLGATEIISSQTVTAKDKAIGTDTSATMISDITNDANTKVIYKVKAGTVGKVYIITIKIITSTDQKFEDRIELTVK